MLVGLYQIHSRHLLSVDVQVYIYLSVFPRLNASTGYCVCITASGRLRLHVLVRNQLKICRRNSEGAPPKLFAVLINTNNIIIISDI